MKAIYEFVGAPLLSPPDIPNVPQRNRYEAISAWKDNTERIWGIGDYVHLHSEDENPYIGRIVALWQDDGGPKQAQIQWIYRVSDLEPQAQPSDALQNEVFFTEHYDSNPIETILTGVRIAFRLVFHGEGSKMLHMKRISSLYADRPDFDSSKMPELYLCQSYYDHLRHTHSRLSLEQFSKCIQVQPKTALFASHIETSNDSSQSSQDDGIKAYSRPRSPAAAFPESSVTARPTQQQQQQQQPNAVDIINPHEATPARMANCLQHSITCSAVDCQIPFCRETKHSLCHRKGKCGLPEGECTQCRTKAAMFTAHSKSCDALLGTCKIPNCEENKPSVWIEHAARCKDDQCGTKFCMVSKKTIVHVKKCQIQGCKTCEAFPPLLKRHETGSCATECKFPSCSAFAQILSHGQQRNCKEAATCDECFLFKKLSDYHNDICKRPIGKCRFPFCRPSSFLTSTARSITVLGGAASHITAAPTGWAMTNSTSVYQAGASVLPQSSFPGQFIASSSSSLYQDPRIPPPPSSPRPAHMYVPSTAATYGGTVKSSSTLQSHPSPNLFPPVIMSSSSVVQEHMPPPPTSTPRGTNGGSGRTSTPSTAIMVGGTSSPPPLAAAAATVTTKRGGRAPRNTSRQGGAVVGLHNHEKQVHITQSPIMPLRPDQKVHAVSSSRSATVQISIGEQFQAKIPKYEPFLKKQKLSAATARPKTAQDELLWEPSCGITQPQVKKEALSCLRFSLSRGCIVAVQQGGNSIKDNENNVPPRPTTSQRSPVRSDHQYSLMRVVSDNLDIAKKPDKLAVVPYEFTFPLMNNSPSSFVVPYKALVRYVPVSCILIHEDLIEQAMRNLYSRQKQLSAPLPRVSSLTENLEFWTDAEFERVTNYVSSNLQNRGGAGRGGGGGSDYGLAQLAQSCNDKKVSDIIELSHAPRTLFGSFAGLKCSLCQADGEPLIFCRRYYACRSCLCFQCWALDKGIKPSVSSQQSPASTNATSTTTNILAATISVAEIDPLDSQACRESFLCSICCSSHATKRMDAPFASSSSIPSVAEIGKGLNPFNAWTKSPNPSTKRPKLMDQRAATPIPAGLAEVTNGQQRQSQKTQEAKYMDYESILHDYDRQVLTAEDALKYVREALVSKTRRAMEMLAMSRSNEK